MLALAGMSHAFLGNHAEALRWFGRSAEDAADKDRGSRIYVHELTARARLLAGDEPGAIAALEKLVRETYRSVPGRLSIHPEFARLRGNPRFDRIITPYRSPS